MSDNTKTLIVRRPDTSWIFDQEVHIYRSKKEKAIAIWNYVSFCNTFNIRLGKNSHVYVTVSFEETTVPK